MCLQRILLVICIGQGVKQNYEEAARWYEKAMAQGKEDATFKLSLITPKLHESGVSCE